MSPLRPPVEGSAMLCTRPSAQSSLRVGCQRGGMYAGVFPMGCSPMPGSSVLLLILEQSSTLPPPNPGVHFSRSMRNPCPQPMICTVLPTMSFGTTFRSCPFRKNPSPGRRYQFLQRPSSRILTISFASGSPVREEGSLWEPEHGPTGQAKREESRASPGLN